MENTLRAARRPPAGNEGLEKLLDFLAEVVQLRGRLGAAGAETLGVCLERVLPAARALCAGGVIDLDGERVADGQLHLGNDEDVGQRLRALVGEEAVALGHGQVHVGLQALADDLGRACLFERAVDPSVHGRQCKKGAGSSG